MSALARLGLLASLYFAQGLPFGFFNQALPAMMRQQGMSLAGIGLLGWLALPWAGKAFWAPLVDRYAWPGWGRRKSWIVPLQLASVLLLLGVALLDPGEHQAWVLGAVLLVNLLAATQDIATDALAIALLPPAERGWANGVQVAGYRVGMILGGGALLLVAERLGWSAVFVLQALALALATLPVLLLVEPASPPPPPGWPGWSEWTRLVRRPGLPLWLFTLLTVKAGEAFGGAMVRPLLVDQGQTLADLGILLGTLGFAAGLVGALLGGALVGPLGRIGALLGFGLLQAALVASGAGLALGWFPPGPALSAWIIAEHLVGGLFTAALFTAMMDAADERSAGSDYSVQASLVVLGTGLAAGLSGFSAQALGYAAHFVLAGALCLVGMAPLVLGATTGAFRAWLPGRGPAA
jgi:MFS family permease